jgi:hypothetical protein
MAVFQELAPGDTLLIGSNTRIRLEHKSGGRARLRIESDQDIERVKAGERLATPAKAPATPAPTDLPRPFLKRP